ncbi:MAG: SPOR domain-containing protein [Oxalobacter sp.]|nr:MAG: SPOR domain-containing protein [Oxalobacter sp.]
MKNLHKQGGSLVLGFIAGLIAGLVIAVIIAMIITKTTSPFTPKQARQGKIAEASSAEPIDPNKALYASASAAQSAHGSSDKASAQAAAKSAAAQQAITKAREPIKTVTPPEPARQPTSVDDPIADKIRQKSKATPAPHKFDDGGEDKWTYMVQTNAYRDSVEAQNERARLALSGFEARVTESKVNGVLLYRVRMGPFSNAEAMNKMIGRLADNGITAVPVRIPKK